MDALSASTATIAAHLAYLDTSSRGLAGRGISQGDATRYFAAVFESVAVDTRPDDFGTLAGEYATAGGTNERFLAALRRAGRFDHVERAPGEVARRLERG